MNKNSNAPSSPMAGVSATPEAPSTPQTAQNSNPTAGQPFGTAPLLDLHFIKKDKSIIMARKTWGNNKNIPDKVEIIGIPLEVIERIKNGEAVKYDGVSISQSSQEELAGVVNVPLENKAAHAVRQQHQ